MLRIAKLCKTFGDEGPEKAVTALSEVDLEIDQGEFVSVIGPSGCGKSTLMEIVAGLERPTGGSVHIDNDEITRPHPDIGVVFQQDATFPWLTSRQNVEFGLLRLGLTKKERARQALDTLELVGVAGFADHHPGQLSGGMRQRLNIARVLAARPRILLMDEPFGALDEQTRLRIGDELLRIWRETGSTVLFITHGLSEAALLSDRIVVMTPRPGQVKEIVVSPLPRTRTSSEIGSPAFADVTGRLWADLSSADPREAIA
ncbi:ABC transporter ATP-binding protein [Qaidamihabitans albus]|uniref:ABC transporter ATP-binding protein n=1 Tax=Qaidamihabitans albus TaxID=2795733 RepID=UPI0018F24409|nr:ABC transporter ATP-binding protein [Qaidamihabitans albus]